MLLNKYACSMLQVEYYIKKGGAHPDENTEK
jgi:hypothetical protein